MQDGRLKSGDRLLQIGDVDVRGLTTEDVATVLRQSGVHVRMIVARDVDSMPDIPDPAAAPIIPVDQLDEHLTYVNQVMDFSRLSSDADLSGNLQALSVRIIRIKQIHVDTLCTGLLFQHYSRLNEKTGDSCAAFCRPDTNSVKELRATQKH